MKKGEKYIIEIEEVHTHVDDNGKKFPLARIKGFSSLVFDQRGLDKLEKFGDNAPTKLLNCKFVATDRLTPLVDYFARGRIYEVVEGKFVGEDNLERPLCGAFMDENDLVHYLKGLYEICVIKE